MEAEECGATGDAIITQPGTKNYKP